MPRFLIDTYSHYFKVTGYTEVDVPILERFLKPLTQSETYKDPYSGEYVTVDKAVYAAHTANYSEIRFHINLLSSFLKLLDQSGIVGDARRIVEHDLYVPAVADMVLANHRKLYDRQVPIAEFFRTPEPRHKILHMQTGRGKTLTTEGALAMIKERTVAFMRPMYMDKWVSDVSGDLGLKPGEYYTIQGAGDLKALIDMAVANELRAKFIIISNKTFQRFISEYENFNGESDLFGCNPDEFFELLKVGVKLVDECHQDLHLMYKIQCYTHVPKSIDLSATLNTTDPFIKKMINIMYPEEHRFQGLEYHRYIAVKALFYTLDRRTKINCIRRGRGYYSHVDFEKSLMKDKRATANYLGMINKVVDVKFIRVKKEGQKMLIFASTKKLCDKIVADLQNRYEDLKVRRYVEEDPYSVLEEGDIIVSTVLSAGTAVDIKKLKVCLQTIAINSQQSNEQALGRLRELEDPNDTPEFYYFVCTDIPKHVQYHQLKIPYFADKVLSHNVMHMREVI